MRASLSPAILGVLVAIGSTTTMDATGYTNFSALPLLPLALIFWAWQRLSRVEMGLTWGNLRGYGLALLYPGLVLGAATLIAFLLGAVDLSEADWEKAGLNMLLGNGALPLDVLETHMNAWVKAQKSNPPEEARRAAQER